MRCNLILSSSQPKGKPSRLKLKLFCKVNQCLSQVSGAIDSQDTVLLGDLLEYELPQHIEKLVALIPMED